MTPDVLKHLMRDLASLGLAQEELQQLELSLRKKYGGQRFYFHKPEKRCSATGDVLVQG